MALLLALAVFTASQGGVVQLTFPDEPGVKSVDVDWQKKKVPFVRIQERWMTVIGVDLDLKPGEQTAEVLFTMEDGRVDRREAIIKVEPTSFPTTELKVEDKYVQLNPADLARATREAKELDAIHSKITNEILWQEPFSVPIPGGKGSNFGHRRIFNGEPRAPHGGADLRAQTGTPIHATNRGRAASLADRCEAWRNRGKWPAYRSRRRYRTSHRSAPALGYARAGREGGSVLAGGDEDK